MPSTLVRSAGVLACHNHRVNSAVPRCFRVHQGPARECGACVFCVRACLASLLSALLCVVAASQYACNVRAFVTGKQHAPCYAAVTLCALHFLSCGMGLSMMKMLGFMNASTKDIPLVGAHCTFQDSQHQPKLSSCALNDMSQSGSSRVPATHTRCMMSGCWHASSRPCSAVHDRDMRCR